MSTYILYGMAASLNTGKIRAYLRRQCISFEERSAGDPRFREEVVPEVGRWIEGGSAARAVSWVAERSTCE